ncbi:MAG: hypothetical protein D6706_03790, partial [Chloroflexi bacterium]
MNRITRIALVIAGVLAVLVIALAIFVIVTIRRPFPQTDGSLTVNGLQEPVEIIRDEYGVAHIYAQNEHDLFFAQGYAHAQDRFWQMEFWRHIGQGRISEIVGEAGVESDKFIRTMGWNRLAENSLTYYEENAPEFMAILEAYSAGVNAYIEEHRDELSVNLTILAMVNEPWEIEPWEPLDTISWGVVMSDDLSGNWRGELRRARLIKALGEATVESLMPTYPYDTRPVIAPTEDLVNEFPEETAVPAPTTLINWNRVNTDIIPVQNRGN